MSSFFEQELRKLFGDGRAFDNPTYSGQACFGTLGDDLRVRAQFVTSGYADHSDSLKITVLNRTEGVVDSLTLKLKDLLGMKPVPGNLNLPGGIAPHIWECDGKPEWYAYHPTSADYQIIQQAVEQYLDVFARQKAQEVFQARDISVCPHLMFPPVADPENPSQDQAAREMRLRLVESCQQVNVYGTTLSEWMWAEINHAILLNIPIVSDVKALKRVSPSRSKTRKPGKKPQER